MYNIFRYRVAEDAPRYAARWISTQHDEMETRYAVGMYQGQGRGYEDAEGRKYDSYRDMPYETLEYTARYQARKRWGYSKLMDEKYW